MQLSLTQLNTHLKSKLAPAYLISTDVPLLAEDARKQILAVAKSHGFMDCELMHVAPGFHWSDFSQATQNKNLFSPQTLIDIRNPAAKFHDEAKRLLQAYCEKPAEDMLVIMTTGKLTAAQQKTKWFKAFKQAGVYLPIWPIPLSELPQWISARAKKSNVNIDMTSAKLLAQFSEGNLLAADQAIHKLALLYPGESITQDKMANTITDNARFNIFDLSQYLLNGDATRAIRVLTGLQQTGTEPTLILWAITKEIRDLFEMKYQLEKGTSTQQVLSRVWQIKKTMTQQALSRLSMHSLKTALQFSSQIDQIIKGAKYGDVWQAFLQLVLILCGKHGLLEK